MTSSGLLEKILEYRDLISRIMFDARMLCNGLLRFRGGLASKAAAALGAACAFMPFDVIPDRLPVIGYFDEVSYVVIGFALSFQLLPQAFKNEFRGHAGSITRNGDSMPRYAEASWLWADPTQMRAAAFRLAALQALAFVMAKPLLRLTMGRWPRNAEVAAFRASFSRFAPVPPLLRALASVPTARHQLMRTMLVSWMKADPASKNELKAELESVTLTGGDQLEVWLGRPVAFLHLEKTAGMSLASFLTARFHPLQIDPDADRVFPPHVKMPFPPHVIDRVKRYPLVWGHYDLPSIRRLGDSRFVFTMLREPKARILSLYWYWRSHGSLYLGRDGHNQPVLAAQCLPLVEFLRSEDPLVRNYIDNFYVRRLTGRYQTGADDPLMLDMDGCLQAALTALSSMDFVGITEDMDRSLAELGSLLEFEPPARSPRVNVTRRPDAGTASGEGPHDPISPLVACELARLTRLDALVYDAAREQFFDPKIHRPFA